MPHPENSGPPDLRTDDTLTASTIVRRGISFQFGPSDMSTIEALTFRMMLVGVTISVVASSFAIGGIARFTRSMHGATIDWALACVLGTMGYYTLVSASAFRRITNHQGSDIPHLREALVSLSTTYGVIAVVLLAAAAVIFGAGVGLIFAARPA